VKRRLFLCSALAMKSPFDLALANVRHAVHAGQLRQLTVEGHGDNRAVYMRDGSRIVYASMRTGKSQIWTIPADGRVPTRLHRSDANDFGRVALNADGSRMSFSSDRDGKNAIFVLDAKGTQALRVSDPDWWSFGPTWSSRNSIAYFSRKGGNGLNIWTVSPDGSNERQVTNGAGESRQPWWSPDGTRMAYSANAGTRTFNIWTCGPDGQHAVPITSHGDWQQPFWSPDLRRIAVSAKNPGANFQIMTMNIDGGDVRLIRQPEGANNVHPAWSPDGRSIVFTSGTGASSSLWQFSFA